MPSAHKGGPPADPFGLVGQTLAGKFLAEAVVAAGGFGVLYRGQHLTLRRPIAIKVLRAPDGLDTKAKEAIHAAFEHEARVIARLSHPAIVHAIEFGVDAVENQPLMWMVLEWLDGRPLSAVLRERRGMPYSAAETFALIRPVLEALGYAHEQGVAHRDLKPANIMVLQGRRGITMKLIDFGIAKAMDEGESAGTGETKTRSAVTAYSPRYAAPEQIGQGRTGPWTDVHAMALILTEMLVGHAAYDAPGSDPTSLVAAALNPERPTPGKFGVNVGAWEPVFRRALAIRSSERYANAGELLDALEQNSSEPALVMTTLPGGGDGPLPETYSGTTSQPSVSGVAAVSQNTGIAFPVEAPRKRSMLPIVAIVALVLVGIAGVLTFATHRNRNTSASGAAAAVSAPATRITLPAMTSLSAPPPPVTPPVAPLVAPPPPANPPTNAAAIAPSIPPASPASPHHHGHHAATTAQPTEQPAQGSAPAHPAPTTPAPSGPQEPVID